MKENESTIERQEYRCEHEHGTSGHVMRLVWGAPVVRVELYVCFRLQQAALVVDGALREKRSIEGMSLGELEVLIGLAENCYAFVRKFNTPQWNALSRAIGDGQELSTEATEQTERKAQ